MNKSIIDLLLAAEDSKFERPFKEVEIKRLTEVLGQKFIVRCEAVSVAKYEEIQEQTMKFDDDGKPDLNINDMQVFTIMEGVIDGEGKRLFSNKELQKKFGAPTPKELVRKLLLSGEISKIYSTISDLSGFKKGSVEEIKN